MRLAFEKMHGAGNDFIVIEDLTAALDFSHETVTWICDRHFGVGADGVILVRQAKDPVADYYMHYYNSDGSLAEMCGNGSRCFAKYLVDRGFIEPEATSLVIETKGGLKPVRFTRNPDGTLAQATVDMGEPVFAWRKIPMTLPEDADACATDRIVGYPIDTPAGSLRITAVNMGNPHAVVWVSDTQQAPVEVVGPFIEHHALFPQRTNVEFAEIVSPYAIRLRVWERGCGETLACGTGACATAVAAAASGACEREITVHLPGGELLVNWSEDNNHVYMTGDAAFSFSGSIELPKNTSFVRSSGTMS